MNAKTALDKRTTAPADQAAKPTTIKDWITAMEPDIKKALPAVITPERFTRMALTAINVNPALAECTPKSFMAALMTAAQLGLEPNTPLGQAYLIPFNNNRKDHRSGQWVKVKEVQFQLGYKGLIELAHRSGQFQVIQAHAVYENDRFEYALGLDPKLVHVPTMENRGRAVAFYAMYKLTNGGFGFEVMSAADVAAHRAKFSQASNKGKSPWDDNFDEMAKKTVLKKTLKYAPISVEFVRDLGQDDSIRTEIDPNMGDVPTESVFELTPDEYDASEGQEAPTNE
jgi:recombination protein RecT